MWKILGLTLLLGWAPWTLGAETVQAETLFRSLDEAGTTILDVRTPAEYGEGHVPGAVNVPHTAILENPEILKAYRDQKLVVYCRSGRRAGMALEALEKAGFDHLTHLQGDMMGWQERGLPVEKRPNLLKK